MYRYIDMSMRNPSQTSNMDVLFGTSDWRQVSAIENQEERAKQTINLYSRQLNAKYVTHMNMYAQNGTLKYTLVHATNHELGREKMKEAMWRVNPDGSFSAFERDNPDQIVLIRVDPDLDILKEKLVVQFSGQKVHLHVVYEWLVKELYLKKHLHEVIRSLRNNGEVTAEGYSGNFAFNKNPSIHFE